MQCLGPRLVIALARNGAYATEGGRIMLRNVIHIVRLHSSLGDSIQKNVFTSLSCLSMAISAYGENPNILQRSQ